MMMHKTVCTSRSTAKNVSAILNHNRQSIVLSAISATLGHESADCLHKFSCFAYIRGYRIKKKLRITVIEFTIHIHALTDRKMQNAHHSFNKDIPFAVYSSSREIGTGCNDFVNDERSWKITRSFNKISILKYGG